MKLKDDKRKQTFTLHTNQQIVSNVNQPTQVDLADDTTLTEKTKEAIINATIEFVFVFSGINKFQTSAYVEQYEFW